MNLPLTSLNNHTSNTFNRNLNDNSLLLSNRSASTMLSPSNLSAPSTVAAVSSMPHQPITNEHLYSTLYGRELELMRKIYKGDNRDHLVESPLMQSPHQPHNSDAMLMKNAGYPINYSNSAATFGVGVPNSPYHHALSPSRTSPKVHHPDQIMSPDNTRMIKQEEKPILFNSPPSSYPGYGPTSMSPTSILGNMSNPMTRKFEADVLSGIASNHKQLYEDRKLQLNTGYPNKDHGDPGYGDNMYADVMNPSNSSVNNFMHLQHEHEKQNQRQPHQNTTKHNNNGQLIGTEPNNHFYNISDYESNDKRQQLHSSHQLFQQNQFSINNTPKDNGGINMTGLSEKSPLNNTTKLNNACSHSDSNNNHNNNDNTKNVRLTSKFNNAANNANENAFETSSRPSKMGPKSIKSDGTSKISASKVNNNNTNSNNNSATNLLSHSKCANETTNDFMLHIRVKEQKQQQQQQQLQNANGRMAQQQMDFDEASNSCDSTRNEDATNYNDDEGDEFMNL